MLGVKHSNATVWSSDCIETKLFCKKGSVSNDTWYIMTGNDKAVVLCVWKNTNSKLRDHK